MIERVRIEGLKETKEALRKLPDATAKNVLRRVLKKRALAVATRAKTLAPELTGNLIRSIVVSTRLTRRQRSLYRKQNRDDVEVFVGPGSEPQAILQEFGTSKQSAQPFMRPAWDAERYGVLQGFRDDMWQEIRKAAERLARKAARGK